MKTVSLCILIFVTCALSLFSCSGDPVGISKDDKTTGIYEADTDPTQSHPSLPEEPEDKPPHTEDVDSEEGRNPDFPSHDELIPLELVLTDDDIKSFDTTTGEIVFTSNAILDKFTTKSDSSIYSNLSLYLNNKLLFKDILILYPQSNQTDDIEFFFDYSTSKFYFYHRYPLPESYLEHYNEKERKERIKRSENLNIAWNTFIEYLNDNGRTTSPK